MSTVATPPPHARITRHRRSGASQKRMRDTLESLTTLEPQQLLSSAAQRGSLEQRLRSGMSSLYSLGAAASGGGSSASKAQQQAAATAAPSTAAGIPAFASKRLVTEKTVSDEQLWGQLSVLYGPLLRGIGEAVDQLATADDSSAVASSTAPPPESQSAAKGKSSVASKKKEATLEKKKSGKDIVDSKKAKAPPSAAGSKKTAAPAPPPKKEDPKKRFYAFGTGGEDDDDDEEDEEDEEAVEKGREGRRFGAGNDDDGIEDDFEEGDDDFNPRADEEEEDGEEDEEEELDPEEEAAVQRELYGDDGDDDAADDLFDEDEDFDAGNDDDAAVGLDDDPLDDLELPEEEEQEDAAAEEAKRWHAVAGPDDADEEDDSGLTPFQRIERERLTKTKRMEEDRLYGNKWAMAGEVGARARPRDSLMDETLDFEHAMNPAPIVTEMLTAKLEERIKQRILNANYDDVQRKVLRTKASDLTTIKRDQEIDAKKSKLSLMDLYEKEFLEKQRKAELAAQNGDGPQTAEPLTEIEKDELRAVHMWRRLAQHLDALSNFFFTPKPAAEQLEARVRAVQDQAPAITLESVGMFARSREEALAPQDVFRLKEGALQGVSRVEMTPQERHALRRATKESFATSKLRRDKQHGHAVADKQRDAKRAEADAASAAAAGKKKFTR